MHELADGWKTALSPGCLLSAKGALSHWQPGERPQTPTVIDAQDKLAD